MRVDMQKSETIDRMDKSHKIDAIKDLNLNPGKLKDPYDALANVSYRWTQIGNAAIAEKLDAKTMEGVASLHYDHQIAPAYAALGMAPMPKEQWMQQAYKEALKYKVEDSYHNSLVKGFLHGDATGSAMMARAARFVLDVGSFANKVSTDVTEKNFSWTDEYRALMSDSKHAGSLFGGMEKETKSTIPGGIVGKMLGLPSTHSFHIASDWLGDGADRLQFQAEIVPNRGIIEKATSFITEQTVMLPLYVGAGESTAALKAAGSAAAPETFTEFLKLSPTGKKAAELLTVGGEGGLVGITTRSNDEKADAWKDALAWMAMHTMFTVGGAGVGKTFTKLGEQLQGKSKAKFDRLDAEYRLNAKGMCSQTEDEVQNGAEEKVANSILAGGEHIPAFHYQQAESMLRKAQAEGITDAELQKHTGVLIHHDPAYWTGPVVAMKHIRSILGDTDIADVKESSPEHQALWARIFETIENASRHMNTYVNDLQENLGEQAVAEAKTSPVGQKVIERMAAEFKMKWESEGHPPLSPEKYQKMAEQEYKESAVYQAKEAETATKPAVVKAAEGKAKAAEIDTVKRRTVNEAAGLMRRRESYFYDKKGRVVGYSMSAKKYYNVYVLEKGGKSPKLTGAAFNSYLGSYLKDLDPKSFSEDLNDYWLPKILQKDGISFETEITAEGKENPNLLAFAYNFRKAMPPALQNELEERLAAQPKMQAAVKGKLTPAHYDYFAETMLAHVDEFYRARAILKDQEKIWRSTASMSVMKPTVSQLILQRQVSQLETAEVRVACAGNRKLKASALELLSKLQKGRLAETQRGIKVPGSSSKRLTFSDEIQHLLDNPAEYVRGEN